MPNHTIKMSIADREFDTLEDILPKNPGLEMLIIGKTPAPVSVRAGHYFQGIQGTMFWNKLKHYELLVVPYGEYEDDYLLSHQFGITDIVKEPREYGNEPSAQEYKNGMQRILELIKIHKPKVVMFVYKGVLDNILKHHFRHKKKSIYGFNEEVEEKFGCMVFVFPMPGTTCTRTEAHDSMKELSDIYI